MWYIGFCSALHCTLYTPVYSVLHGKYYLLSCNFIKQLLILIRSTFARVGVSTYVLGARGSFQQYASSVDVPFSTLSVPTVCSAQLTHLGTSKVGEVRFATLLVYNSRLLIYTRYIIPWTWHDTADRLQTAERCCSSGLRLSASKLYVCKPSHQHPVLLQQYILPPIYSTPSNFRLFTNHASILTGPDRALQHRQPSCVHAESVELPPRGSLPLHQVSKIDYC